MGIHWSRSAEWPPGRWPTDGSPAADGKGLCSPLSALSLISADAFVVHSFVIAAQMVAPQYIEFSLERVVEYAQRMDSRTILKHLGYSPEAVGLLRTYQHLLAGLEPSADYPKLDPLPPRRGPHDTPWKLLINCQLDRRG